jgi:hypothetical protein
MVVGFTTTYAIPITTKTDSHDITEILLKVSLNTINQTPITTKVVSSNPAQTRCTRFKRNIVESGVRHLNPNPAIRTEVLFEYLQHYKTGIQK